jgi:hypothetical protein
MENRKQKETEAEIPLKSEEADELELNGSCPYIGKIRF